MINHQRLSELKKLSSRRLVSKRRRNIFQLLFPEAFQVEIRNIGIMKEVKKIEKLKLVSSKKFKLLFRKVEVLTSEDEKFKSYEGFIFLFGCFQLLFWFYLLYSLLKDETNKKNMCLSELNKYM